MRSFRSGIRVGRQTSHVSIPQRNSCKGHSLVRALLATLFCTVLLATRDAGADTASPPQTPVNSNANSLLTLADRAGFNLTDCEKTLLDSLPKGEYANCQSNNDSENDPSKGDQWPESRQIRPELIRWLCVNEDARKLIDPKGIRIYGAKIPDALDLDFISVPFEINIQKSRLSQGLSLIRAQVGTLNLGGSYLNNPGGDALQANGINVAGAVFLSQGFKATGGVDLGAATIGSNLECDGGTFSNPNGTALNANSIKVEGAVFLSGGFNATGGVDLGAATIGGDLECEKGTFSNPNGTALEANSIKVAGPVFLRSGFNATGSVDLGKAEVGGDLDCSGGTFSNPNGTALNANGIKVEGAVFLSQGFKATGGVNLGAATIGSNLDCDGGTFSNPKGTALNAYGANIKGAFWWTDITSVSNANQKSHYLTLNLFDATVGSVTDDEKSWPLAGQLSLSGFKFDHLEGKDKGWVVQRDANSGLRWLRLQDPYTWSTQPYEQFAKVLESEGDDGGARQVRIGMEDDLYRNRPFYWRICGKVLEYTIGYGYEPWLALWWALGFVTFGYLSFSLGYRSGVIAPTDDDAFKDFQKGNLPVNYQPFNGFVYSLDTFLPIINLGLKDHWMPDPNLTQAAAPRTGTWLGDLVGAHIQIIANRRFFKSGAALRAYYWCHLLLGWVLITLFAAGFTGIIRR